MSAIDRKYVKINISGKHEWGFVVKRAGCKLRYKWQESGAKMSNRAKRRNFSFMPSDGKCAYTTLLVFVGC